jgi:hypothetical protein
VKVWAHQVEQLVGGPEKVSLIYLRSPSGAPKRTFYSYRRLGFPTPQLYDRAGKMAVALLLEQDYAGTLRTLVHPLFVLLSAPATPGAVRFLRSMTAVSQQPLHAKHLYPSGSEVIRKAAQEGTYVGLDAAACQVAFVAARLARGQKLDVTLTAETVELMLSSLKGDLRDEILRRLRGLPGVYEEASDLTPTSLATNLAKIASKGRDHDLDGMTLELSEALTGPLRASDVCEIDFGLGMPV